MSEKAEAQTVADFIDQELQRGFSTTFKQSGETVVIIESEFVAWLEHCLAPASANQTPEPPPAKYDRSLCYTAKYIRRVVGVPLAPSIPNKAWIPRSWLSWSVGDAKADPDSGRMTAQLAVEFLGNFRIGNREFSPALQEPTVTVFQTGGL